MLIKTHAPQNEFKKFSDKDFENIKYELLGGDNKDKKNIRKSCLGDFFRDNHNIYPSQFECKGGTLRIDIHRSSDVELASRNREMYYLELQDSATPRSNTYANVVYPLLSVDEIEQGKLYTIGDLCDAIIKSIETGEVVGIII